jgi:flagellar FliL protein
MVDEAENEDKKHKGSIVTKILLFGVLPTMTAIILVIGTLLIAGVIPRQGGNSNTEASVDVGEEDEELYDDEDTGVDALTPAIYIPLDPAFVVNFTGQGKARFLQVTVEVMTRDIAVPDLVKLHAPAIRNSLMLLLSDQLYENISTLDGKEILREEALEVIQLVLEEEAGDPGIEAVYFTSFVMQ